MKSLSDDQMRVLIDEFFTESDEDVVGLFAIAQAVEDLIKDKDMAREQALRVVEGLLDRGMLAGQSPYCIDGYQPWPDQDRTTVINRIRSEWLALGRSPTITDIVWFGPPQ
jgi:hypothetical protein